MISLRVYQFRAHAAVRTCIAKGFRRVLVVMPTGTGKTMFFFSYARAGGGKVLLVAHRDELITQAWEEAVKHFGESAVAIYQRTDKPPEAQVIIASIATLTTGNRLARSDWPTFAIVGIDEAHHASPENEQYEAVIGRFAPRGTDVQLIGLTATMDRADGASLKGVFERVAYRLSIAKAIRQGYICPIIARPYAVKGLDLSKVGKGKSGDLDENAVGEAFMKGGNKAVVAAMKLHAKGRRSLVFTSSVEQAKILAADLYGAGITADWIAGSSKNREALLRAHKARQIEALVNCSVLTEGYNDPGIDCIAMARLTNSHLLFAQIAGRGLRMADGKKDCVLLYPEGGFTAAGLASVGALEEEALDVIPVEVDDVAEEERDEGTNNAKERTKRFLEAISTPSSARYEAPWVQARCDLWVSSAGTAGAVVVREVECDRYRVEILDRVKKRPEALGAEPVDLEEAQTRAEAWRASVPSSGHEQRGPAWRHAPADFSLKAALVRRGIEPPAGVIEEDWNITSGAAVDELLRASTLDAYERIPVARPVAAREILGGLQRRGVRLVVERGELLMSAPPGRWAREDSERVQKYKSAIIDVLRRPGAAQMATW